MTAPLYSYALHDQFLNTNNKILEGHGEQFFEAFPSNAEMIVSLPCTVEISTDLKIVYAIGFTAQDPLEKTLKFF